MANSDITDSKNAELYQALMDKDEKTVLDRSVAGLTSKNSFTCSELERSSTENGMLHSVEL